MVEEPEELGQGCSVWHYCHVIAGARIGRECSLGQGCFVAATAVIGDRVKIQNNVSVYDGVVLEDDVFCGPSCVFTNVLRPRSAFPRKLAYERTVVGRGATIGANATILPGVRVGAHAMVGAGAVVTKDVDPYRIVVGNPARPLGHACACGERLAAEASAGKLACAACRKTYTITQGLVRPIEEISE